MIKKLSDILFVTDMDGTLMFKTIGILPRNLEAVERFVKKGGKFTIATGRAPLAARRYLDKLPISLPIITFNGGAIYDYTTKSFLWSASLPDAAVTYAQKIMDRFEDIGLEIVQGNAFHIIRKNEYILELMRAENIEDEHISYGNVDRNGIKMLFAGECDCIQRLKEYVKQENFEGVDFVQSELHYFEMLPKGQTKGTTLQKLADLLKIPMENTVAIGDYYNDEDMVIKAGIGAFVADAPKDLLGKADYVAGRFEDGAVANFIEYLEEKFPE